MSSSPHVVTPIVTPIVTPMSLSMSLSISPRSLLAFTWTALPCRVVITRRIAGTRIPRENPFRFLAVVVFLQSCSSWVRPDQYSMSGAKRMTIKCPPPRCTECGQSLTGAPNSYDTLAQENGELRKKVAELVGELQYQNGGGFVASVHAQTFHRPTCEWARKIPERNLVEFDSHEAAVRAGNNPCKTCKA